MATGLYRVAAVCRELSRILVAPYTNGTGEDLIMSVGLNVFSPDGVNADPAGGNRKAVVPLNMLYPLLVQNGWHIPFESLYVPTSHAVHGPPSGPVNPARHLHIVELE
jgi:hypothetical protein